MFPCSRNWGKVTDHPVWSSELQLLPRISGRGSRRWASPSCLLWIGLFPAAPQVLIVVIKGLTQSIDGQSSTVFVVLGKSSQFSGHVLRGQIQDFVQKLATSQFGHSTATGDGIGTPVWKVFYLFDSVLMDREKNLYGVATSPNAFCAAVRIFQPPKVFGRIGVSDKSSAQSMERWMFFNIVFVHLFHEKTGCHRLSMTAATAAGMLLTKSGQFTFHECVHGITNGG